MPRRTVIYTALLLSAFSAFAQKRPAAPSKKPAPAAQLAMDRAAYPIVDIAVSGSDRYDADDIIKATGLKKDKNIVTPLEDIKAAAQKLADSGAFAQVNYKHSASANGARVEFVFTDRDDDQFLTCDFANFVWWPENDLLVELHSRVPLFNGTVPHDGTLADEVNDALQALLKERGIAGSVSHEHVDAINGDPATEAVLYRVTDVDIHIAKVELNGASSAMQAEASAALQHINGLVYNRTTVKKFINHNLRNVYLRHGYLRATFDAPELKVLPDSNSSRVNLSLVVPVAEGRPYKAHDVRWSGNKAMLAESLDPYLHLLPGVTVDGVRLKQDIDNVRYHYAALGYLHMLLDAKPIFNETAGSVDYQMTVKEGDLFEMGKFDVEGMSDSLSESLRHAWQLREGQPFDPTYLNMFLKNVKAPPNTAYLVDESQGERPKSIDITIRLCGPSDPCKPNSENHLYTPPGSEEEK